MWYKDLIIGKKKNKLDDHVGGPNSAHNQAQRMSQNLLNQRQNIQTMINQQTDRERSEYRLHLNASIDYVKFLQQGLAFRGHDESEHSSN